MFDYMTVKHVHARVVGELKFDLDGFTRIKIPGLFHRFVGITCPSIPADALLRDIVKMHGMRLIGRVGKDPLLSGPKGRPGVDTIWVEP